jgi:hypothetical protein
MPRILELAVDPQLHTFIEAVTPLVSIAADLSGGRGAGSEILDVHAQFGMCMVPRDGAISNKKPKLIEESE